MKKFFKIISGLILSLILFFGLVGLYLKIVFTEEKLRNLAQEIVSKSIPNGKIHLGKVNIHLGWNFTFEIDNLTLSDREDLTRENSLVFFKSLNFRIPIYSILDQIPEIDLKVSELEIRSFEKLPNELLENKEGSPLPVVEKPSLPENKSFLEKVKDGAHGYGDRLLKNSHINIASQNISFFRIYLKREPKKVNCQNIKISFESASHPLSLYLKCSGDTGETEPGLKGIITLEGQINIKEFIENKNLNFSGSFVLENPNYPPIGDIPTIRGTVNGLLLNDEGVKVPIKASVDKWGQGSLILTNHSGETILDSVDWNFNFGVLDFLLKKMPFSRKGNLSLNGKLSFLDKGFFPEIDLKTENLVLTLNNTEIPVSISGKIQGKNYNMKTLVRIFKGSADSDVAGTINWDDLSKPFGPMKITTLISSMEFKGPQKKKEAEIKKENDFEYPLPDFPLTLKMKIQKVKLEKIRINGTGALSIGKRKKSKLDMKFTLGDAPADLNAELFDIQENAFINFSLSGFDLALLENLIPENLGIFKGKGDLDFTGTLPFPHTNAQEFSFKVNLFAVNGDYNNPSLGKNWEVFIKENPGLEKYISKNAQPYVEFEQILFSGEVQKGKIKINKFLFQAPKDKLLIHANGYLGIQKDQKSLFYVDLRDKIGITLPGMKKLLGMETLYFKLVGNGLKLKPDLVYTSSKVLEKTVTELPGNLWTPVDKILINPFRKLDESFKKKP
jgi:hypothetical protein